MLFLTFLFHMLLWIVSWSFSFVFSMLPCLTFWWFLDWSRGDVSVFFYYILTLCLFVTLCHCDLEMPVGNVWYRTLCFLPLIITLLSNHKLTFKLWFSWNSCSKLNTLYITPVMNCDNDRSTSVYVSLLCTIRKKLSQVFFPLMKYSGTSLIRGHFCFQ